MWNADWVKVPTLGTIQRVICATSDRVFVGSPRCTRTLRVSSQDEEIIPNLEDLPRKVPRARRGYYWDKVPSALHLCRKPQFRTWATCLASSS